MFFTSTRHARFARISNKRMSVTLDLSDLSPFSFNLFTIPDKFLTLMSFLSNFDSGAPHTSFIESYDYDSQTGPLNTKHYFTISVVFSS